MSLTYWNQVFLYVAEQARLERERLFDADLEESESETPAPLITKSRGRSGKAQSKRSELPLTDDSDDEPYVTPIPKPTRSTKPVKSSRSKASNSRPAKLSQNEPMFASSAERKFKDPFTLSNYPTEVALFERYYPAPVERLLRYFIYIYYMYHVLTPATQIRETKRILNSPNVKAQLDDFTESFLLEEYIYYFYKHYNPAKANRKQVQEVINRYSFREYRGQSGDVTNELVNRLYQLYIYDPTHPDEPMIHEPLWFGVDFGNSPK